MTLTKPYPVSAHKNDDKDSSNDPLQFECGFPPDAVLICGHRAFNVHRSVLSEISPFFESALTKGWSETTSGVLQLPTVSAESIEAILSFVYNGHLRKYPHSVAEILKLLQDANYLQANELVKVFSRTLCDRYLNFTKFQDVCSFVDELNDETCAMEVATYFGKNFNKISRSFDFPYIQANLFKKILQHLDASKTTLEMGVTSVLKWMEFEMGREALLKSFMDILEKVWCPECLNDFLNKNIHLNWSTHLINCLSTFTAKQLQNISKVTTTSEREKLVCFQVERTRGQWMGIGCDESHVIRILDLKETTWSENKKIPVKLMRDGMAVIAYRYHIYFMGGLPDRGTTYGVGQVLKYCPFTNVVLMSEELLAHPISYAGIAVLNDFIYVVNGRYKTPYLRSVQRYNPYDRTCKMVASTNFSRCSPTVIPFNNALFITGKWYEGGNNVIERYSPIADQWTIVTEIPESPFRCCTAGCGELLFIRKYLKFRLENQFHVYDLGAERWSVTEFQNGPDKIRDLVAVGLKEKPIICAIDGVGWLRHFDVLASEWLPEPDGNNKWFTRYFCAI